MKKNILIPTDFSVESLNVVRSFLHEAQAGYKYNIVLVYGAYLNDSISDLLFFSRSRMIDSFCDKSFDDACDIIKNKYASQVEMIRKDIFTGRGQAAFEHYLEANHIDEAYIPGNYTLQLKKNGSFDTVPLIRASRLNIREVNWKRAGVQPENGKLAEVFLMAVE